MNVPRTAMNVTRMQHAQTEMEHTPVHATMVMKEMALIALISTNVMVRMTAI